MKTDKEIKEIQHKFLEDMKGFNFPRWVTDRNRELMLNLSFSGVSHVAKGLTDLTFGYAGQGQYLGSFLVEIKKESLVSACCRADAINMIAIPIYANFIYNIVPVDLRIKK